MGQPPSTPFTYENLSPRGPSPVTSVAKAVLPGVRRVLGQTEPYAAWWRERNLAALEEDGPLWVVLGDSMSQGIGASRVELGWVPRVEIALQDADVPVRVLNLSFSGARTGEVTDLQLPVLDELGLEPDVVTVLVGSNDLLRRSLRAELPERYAELLDALPHGSLVATMPGAGRMGHVAEQVQEHPDVVAVPLSWSRGEIAEDRFHPDDRAYARLARTFERPIASALRVGRRSLTG